ncbi:hypothetical protein C8R47DRAFT_1227660 [Mycena vitilis]|nr:hypothetical protein C8R47DRAFT_1227660 [Mycena vitilis]
MDAGLPPGIIAELEGLITSRYVNTAGYVVLLYDHLLTFPDEVEYIWSAPNTLAKVLFLIMRYTIPLFLTGEAISAFAPYYPSRTHACSKNVFLSAKRVDHHRDDRYISNVPLPSVVPTLHFADAKSGIQLRAQTYGGWVTIVISNFLVLLRIGATLPRGHRLIVWGLAFFAVMQVASLGVTSWVVFDNMWPAFFFDETIGLCSFSFKPNVVGLWIPGLIFELVVFVTVCWNELDRPRALATDSDSREITRVLFRDGVVYFVILFGLRVANTILALAAPLSIIFVAVYFIWSATTVTTSRLIINSRREVGRAERRRASLQALRFSTGTNVNPWTAPYLDPNHDPDDQFGVYMHDREREAERSEHAEAEREAEWQVHAQEVGTREGKKERERRKKSYARWSKGGSFWV